jgi:hypothetical protein
MDHGEHSPSHIFPSPDSEREPACTRLVVGVRRVSNTAVGIHDKSRMRKRGRTHLCGGAIREDRPYRDIGYRTAHLTSASIEIEAVSHQSSRSATTGSTAIARRAGR